MKRKIYLTLLLIETTVLLYVSFLATQPSIMSTYGLPIRQGDIEHFMAFFLYGFLVQRSFEHKTNSKFHLILLGLILGSLLGGISETIQYFIPNRFGDILDWTIDSSGSLFGGMFGVRYMLVKRK